MIGVVHSMYFTLLLCIYIQHYDGEGLGFVAGYECVHTEQSTIATTLNFIWRTS